jgi:DeoR/GlpR family transcriptional regulator of sugar metabolism
MRANNLCLSASGLTFPEGITDPNLLEIQVKQAMAASAERVILLMDSSKFGQRSLATVLPLEQVAFLVTDEGTPQEAIVQLQAAGIDIHVVESTQEH